LKKKIYEMLEQSLIVSLLSTFFLNGNFIRHDFRENTRNYIFVQKTKSYK